MERYRPSWPSPASGILVVMLTVTVSLSFGFQAGKLRADVPRVAETDSVATEIVWLSDYAEAVDQANRQGKVLLIYFTDADERDGDGHDSNGGKAGLCRRFETRALSDRANVQRLQRFVCAKLPLDATVDDDGTLVMLLEDRSFREMLGCPGIAMIDYRDRSDAWFGHVVSTFPLNDQFSYSSRQLAVILDLPPGTLTQRTLVYAVRTHGDRPASTNGHLDPFLVNEANKHSRYQARIRRQGHHQWASRFQRITAVLPPGLTAIEVCAESWPGEGLLEAAVECVRCWRLSPGHWSAVRAKHQRYGYDMKRGSNRIWYATGIFGGE